MEWSKYQLKYIYDEPIRFKNIIIYPALVKDYVQFYYLSECLTLDKNSVTDAKIISMTYLDYMFSVSTEEKPYVSFFDALLKIVTRNENLKVMYGKNKKGKNIFVIDGVEYNHSDFEEIRKIISEYNNVEIPDEKIQKEIRDNMQKAREIRARISGTKMASIEDQIVCVLISTSFKLEDIFQLSIRKFAKVLERADAKLHYEIYLSASMSGFVEFKDKSFIKHWMADLTKEKLDLVPMKQVEGSMSSKNAKVRNTK